MVRRTQHNILQQNFHKGVNNKIAPSNLSTQAIRESNGITVVGRGSGEIRNMKGHKQILDLNTSKRIDANRAVFPDSGI